MTALTNTVSPAAQNIHQLAQYVSLQTCEHISMRSSRDWSTTSPSWLSTVVTRMEQRQLQHQSFHKVCMYVCVTKLKMYKCVGRYGMPKRRQTSVCKTRKPHPNVDTYFVHFSYTVWNVSATTTSRCVSRYSTLCINNLHCLQVIVACSLGLQPISFTKVPGKVRIHCKW